MNDMHDLAIVPIEYKAPKLANITVLKVPLGYAYCQPRVVQLHLVCGCGESWNGWR